MLVNPSSTATPSNSDVSIQSPWWKASSKIIFTEAKKFESVSLEASAIAKQPHQEKQQALLYPHLFVSKVKEPRW